MRGRLSIFILRAPQSSERSAARIEFQLNRRAEPFIGLHNEALDPIERVTAVLPFAGCPPNKQCLYCRYEFINYCPAVPAASH
jgi:hypothetical protein